jgi:hypothetical protein
MSLLAGELALPWCYPLLGGGWPSMGLRLPPSVMIVASLGREAGFGYGTTIRGETVIVAEWPELSPSMAWL